MIRKPPVFDRELQGLFMIEFIKEISAQAAFENKIMCIADLARPNKMFFLFYVKIPEEQRHFSGILITEWNKPADMCKEWIEMLHDASCNILIYTGPIDGINFLTSVKRALMWIVYALLSAVFASLTAIFAKVGVKDVDSDLATAIRTSVIIVLAWGIAFFKGVTPQIASLTKHTLLFLVLSGIATGLSWMFYFKALQAGDVSKVAPLDKLSVALTIILGIVIFHEPMSVKEWVGAGLIVAGAMVMVL